MKPLKLLFALPLTLFFCLTLTACKENSQLDATIYCRPEIKYTLASAKDKSLTAELSQIIDNSMDLQAYKTIQITTNKSWTYGMILERVEFNVLLSEAANVDIDITITNVENGENHDTSTDTYFYHKTISANKENTTVRLDVNDTLINKDSVISIEIVESCYSNNPALKLAIGNFRLYGKHTPTNY